METIDNLEINASIQYARNSEVSESDQYTKLIGEAKITTTRATVGVCNPSYRSELSQTWGRDDKNLPWGVFIPPLGYNVKDLNSLAPIFSKGELFIQRIQSQIKIDEKHTANEQKKDFQSENEEANILIHAIEQCLPLYGCFVEIETNLLQFKKG